ncbi:L,D-transpeptidase family protein [Sporocytophaga myxococcoides]|uniref:L,D-transpeptidase family protein n=1 Tax=Sporocytophaga myxococcoides TaxID=153721 RepID=UPI0004919011|nr:L,D-transpeptidase family protein [Sporocytophaga myxococcoides]
MKILIMPLILVSTILSSMFFIVKNKGQDKIKNIRIDKVLVLKSKREMYLLSNGKKIKTYKIALGDNPIGHKVQEGDERTPEGNYVLDWRNNKSSCYRSIHISYPNAVDVKNAKKLKVSPGGSIMIHGLHPSINWMGSFHTKQDWTDGCIAVSNDEMDEIWDLIKYGTPIEIRK